MLTIFVLWNLSRRIHVWYVFLYIWLIFMVNVGKYTSPMDAMGIVMILLTIQTWWPERSIASIMYCIQILKLLFITHTIHGTGIFCLHEWLIFMINCIYLHLPTFTYMYHQKINHSCRYIYNRPMDGMGNVTVAELHEYVQCGSGSHGSPICSNGHQGCLPNQWMNSEGSVMHVMRCSTCWSRGQRSRMLKFDTA